MIVEHIGGTSFSLSNSWEIDFSLSTNRNLNFYRVHFQGDILDAIFRYFGRNLALWTIPCYRPKQGAFHDKSLISTRKSSHEQTKKGQSVEPSIWQNDAGQFVSCAYSPYLVVIACIMTDFQSINAKRSPHALYQNMRTQLASYSNFDTKCKSKRQSENWVQVGA